jgi:hypothetical protein
VGPLHVERKHGLRAHGHAAPGEVVSMHAGGDHTGITIKPEVALQALGQPGAP